MQLRRYIWESSADGNFAISEDTENEPLGRGTDIRIHLKESAAEYATEEKLRVCIFLTPLGAPGSEADMVTYYECQFRSLFFFFFPSSDFYSRTSLSLILRILQELVQRYSQFISFPIYLWASKDEVIEVDEDEPAATKDDLTYEKGTSGEESEDKGLEETDGTDDEPNSEEGEE